MSTAYSKCFILNFCSYCLGLFDSISKEEGDIEMFKSSHAVF